MGPSTLEEDYLANVPKEASVSQRICSNSSSDGQNYASDFSLTFDKITDESAKICFVIFLFTFSQFHYKLDLN